MSQDDELDNLGKAVLNLPADWWQRKTSAVTLLQLFRRHIVALLVAGRVSGEMQHNVYTGIMLDHNGLLIWVTAGHVIDELNQILNSPSFELSTIAWLDEYEHEKAVGVRLHRLDIPMKSWTNHGLDLGIAIPSLLDAGNIRLNPKVLPLGMSILQNIRQASPEGYFGIGFPRPWSTREDQVLTNRQTHHSARADLACLPLESVSPPPEMAHDPTWADPQAFYGRLLPFADDPTFVLDDLKGMSGGPILSVERNSKGEIGYRWAGTIQKSALGQTIIRAEPIHRVAEAINSWLRDQGL